MSDWMNNQGGGDNNFLGLFNMFSGGAIEQLSVFALGSCRTFPHPSFSS